MEAMKNAFEVYAGNVPEEAVYIALKADFSVLIGEILARCSDSNPAVYAFGKQIQSAGRVTQGLVQLNRCPDLVKNRFELVTRDDKQEDDDGGDNDEDATTSEQLATA